jgi:ABC-type branched-subunit amino acid transport system ATPase component
MEPEILIVSNLAKTFGSVRAVDGCSFEVRRGTVTALIGPNGAGKSTTVDLISGIAKPEAGRVVFDGRDITGLAPHVIANAGLTRTFQKARGWARLTVLENLLVAAAPNGREAIWRTFLTPRALSRAELADRERARDILDAVGLLHLKNDAVETLRGGQKRLLEFARILMARPKLAILDEPVAGVNPVLAQRIGAAIAELTSLDITVVVVEHNLEFVEQTCTQVIVMAAGKTIATGTLDELRQNPEVVDAYLGDVSVRVA